MIEIQEFTLNLKADHFSRSSANNSNVVLKYDWFNIQAVMDHLLPPNIHSPRCCGYIYCAPAVINCVASTSQCPTCWFLCCGSTALHALCGFRDDGENTQCGLIACTSVMHNYSELAWPGPAFPRKVLVLKFLEKTVSEIW